MTIPTTAREAPPRVTAEELAERLGARRTGERRWMALCPAHGDKSPSLSICQGDDGRVLLHCHAGCTFGDVVAALGLEPRQLFPESGAPWRPTRPRPDPELRVRVLFEKLSRLRRPPEPQRFKRELWLVGTVILQGPEALAALAAKDVANKFRVHVLRIIFEAMVELARESTPRRWFSPLAIARQIDHVAAEAGYARRLAIYSWCRMSVRIAAACDALEERQEAHRG